MAEEAEAVLKIGQALMVKMEGQEAVRPFLRPQEQTPVEVVSKPLILGGLVMAILVEAVGAKLVVQPLTKVVAVEQEDQELGGAAAPVAQDVHSLQAEQALPMVAEEVVVLSR